MLAGELDSLPMLRAGRTVLMCQGTDQVFLLADPVTLQTVRERGLLDSSICMRFESRQL